MSQTLELMLKNIEKEINEDNGVIKSKQEYISKTETSLTDLDKKKKDNIEKKLILQEACKKARELSSDMFANISTNGVKTILGDNLEVKIIPGEKNGVPTSDFVIKAKYLDYETETDPISADGGGVADIVSLTNFLTMNIINSNINSASIILDEPTKFVSAGNADNVGFFLREISENFNKQIIMVTHAQETKKYANKIFTVALNDRGTSVVTEDNNNENP